MKKHFFSIAILIMFIVGLSVLLYPAISDYLNSKHASKVISEYNDRLSVSSEEEIEAVFKKAEDYNKRLHDEPSAFFEPSLVSGYDDTLDITGAGIMGYIDIDKINVELPIYHGIKKEVLQVGVGHLSGTSLPVGGESTHCVLSGHRGLPSAKLFTDLDELGVGDTFTITVLDRRFTYEIDQIKTVLPEEFEDLRIVEGKDYCTLLTCTPYGINTHRLLVRGVRTGNTEEKKVGVFVRNEAFRIDPLIVAPIAAVPLLIITFTLIFISDKRRRKKPKK
ncbi:class C sortase [Ruminococcus sp.]|uniref:class C sortase n=1 Tax=Ruminococcus sp. TaxID=41978 RepID=UPI0025CD46DB|nr:class C sortase [Ruminococcus sp.]MCR4639270.1 class C sortase [Ruminococcus sp.]